MPPKHSHQALVWICVAAALDCESFRLEAESTESETLLRVRL